MSNAILMTLFTLTALWLLISTQAFFQFESLECVEYSTWESRSNKTQVRECILYKKENHE